jgi:hypothetical protein
LTNLVRAGLARVTSSAYEPFPTVYDGLFPDGTFLTAPTRPAAPKLDPSAQRSDPASRSNDEETPRD